MVLFPPLIFFGWGGGGFQSLNLVCVIFLCIKEYRWLFKSAGICECGVFGVFRDMSEGKPILIQVYDHLNNRLNGSLGSLLIIIVTYCSSKTLNLALVLLPVGLPKVHD